MSGLRGFAYLVFVLVVTACSATGEPSSSAPSASPPPQPGGLVRLDPLRTARYAGTIDASSMKSVTIQVVALGAAEPAFEPTIIGGAPGRTLDVVVVQSDDHSADFQHNFSVTSLGIDRDIPRGAGRHIQLTITLPASGVLPFFCKYHADAEYHAGAFRVA